ncbi:MAG TPA: TetR/AcrR family transcriptional regulator [Desulfitobacterium dehalogenans]|uniref:TetR/AcrR family transcriptional regulator n=1 Tax=Desulfitobacterium dehalogenans TaxID=36854 RepID=A0A7C6Z6F1_9FIRM|nr:TetR/AcrR family transcriptional regulator [Desulfitobacterium dehalogenans]
MKRIDVSREDILKIGMELLTSGNVRTLTLRDLSSQTGVSVGTLYNYFGDKEQLQREVLGYFWKIAMHQESILNCDNIDFISHVEQSYSLFFKNLQKINSSMSNNTSNIANKCDIQANFPMKHIAEKLESWIERLMELHNNELKEVEMKCTRAEIINYIVDTYMGNFLRGYDNLGIAMKVLRAYL